MLVDVGYVAVDAGDFGVAFFVECSLFEEEFFVALELELLVVVVCGDFSGGVACGEVGVGLCLLLFGGYDRWGVIVGGVVGLAPSCAYSSGEGGDVSSSIAFDGG